MNLPELLQLKFSNLGLTSQVIIQDDGNGPYIKKWDEALGPKPDQATLTQWELEVKDKYDLEQVRQQRKEEYNNQGVTIEALTVALWEKLANNNSTEFDSLQAKREAIKQQFPKPVVDGK